MRNFILLIFLTGSVFEVQGQTMKGKIFQHGYDRKNTPIQNVTVRNSTRQTTALSNAEGTYEINAEEGDVITFSSSGFLPDTLRVQKHNLVAGSDILLLLKNEMLQNVTVSGSYQRDSLGRRLDYEKIYDQAGITGRNTPEAGFGIVLSPISYFSKQSRRERQLKKRLKQQEKDYYINYVFPEAWVANLTKLQVDDLKLFMYKYRPSYEFAKKYSHEQLTQYVNNKLIEFKREKVARK